MKQATAQELFSLLKRALGDESFDSAQPVSSSVRDYVELEGLAPFFSREGKRVDALAEDFASSMKRAIHQKVTNATAEQIILHSKEAGVPAAILKGTVLQECYPEGIVRVSSDIDVFVPPQFADEFERVMDSMGAQKECDVDTLQIGVADYFFPNGVHVEAHYIIAIQWSESQRSFARETGLFSPDTFVSCSSAGVELMTLDPMLHLAYLIYHFIKHLMFWEQNTVRMLADITLFARKHEEEIDRDLFKELIEGLGYTKIADAIFEIGSEYLGVQSNLWRPTQTGLAAKMIRMIPEKSGRYQNFRERLAWSTYHVYLVKGEDGLIDTKLVFRPYLFVGFLPFSIHWAWRRSFWQLETDYSSRSR